MKVLMMSTDRSVFDKDSAFRARLALYGTKVGHITVLALGVRGDEQLTDQVHVMGVRGMTKIGSLYAAYKKAKKILDINPVSWVVTTQDEITGLVGFRLRGIFGVPWRAEVHTDIMSPWFGKIFFTNKIRKLIFRLTISRASCIRVVSKRIKSSLEHKRFVRAPIVVVPVKPREPLVHASPPRERFFLVISRLTKEKNVALALFAFSDIVATTEDVILKIVGDGPEKARLERLAAHLGIRNRVVFLGWQKEIDSSLSGAVGVLSTSWYEGFGLSLLEAMAAGYPVITTDVGIVGETLKDGQSGLVVRPGDRAGFANAMARLLQDTKLAVHLGNAAKEASRLYFDEAVYWQAFDASFSVCKPKN
ncbi:MAG: glycosyltransferase [Patescibacteria group bacterium]